MYFGERCQLIYLAPFAHFEESKRDGYFRMNKTRAPVSIGDTAMDMSEFAD